MFKIYLCGFINGEKIKECIAWRKQIRSYYLNKGWNKILFLDPLNGDERETIDKEGLTSSVIPWKAIVHRDYNSVKNSDLIIANLDTFGATRPLTGSIYELAWAWREEIPVIVISKDPMYVKHPFIKDTASVIVESVDELLEKKYLPYFYKGQVQAIY